jgi:spoIIIJ-associated protein
MNAKTVEQTGRTAEEAVEAALRLLGATRDEVDVEYLDMGAKGFLGLGSKMAKVSVTKRFDPVFTAQRFLREMFAVMGFSVTPDIKLDGKALHVSLSGSDAGLLIGKKGQVMDSLQYLLSLIINKGEAAYATVSLDIENYRQRRKETLENLAVNLAKKVRTTKRSSRLEPMSSYERRVIHSALQGDRNITTYSEGVEPYRNVVIALKKDTRNQKPETRDRDR